MGEGCRFIYARRVAKPPSIELRGLGTLALRAQRTSRKRLNAAGACEIGRVALSIVQRFVRCETQRGIWSSTVSVDCLLAWLLRAL